MIKSLSLEESKITEIQMLDWLTSPEINKGKVTDKYWLIDTDVVVNTEYPNYQVELLNKLLSLCKIHEFTLLQIRKNETIINSNSNGSPEQQSGDSGITSESNIQEPGTEIPSASVGSEHDGEKS